MSTGLRLFCPAEATDWSTALITEREIELCKSIASRLGLAIRIDQGHGKLYLGRGQAPPAKKPPLAEGDIYHDCTWYYQGDSEMTQQAWRMCNASTHAMFLKFHRPDLLAGPRQGDDEFLRRVLTFGDTVNTANQIKALASYGLKARFVPNMTWAGLMEDLRRGPVPVGWIHTGHISAINPNDGGHWSLVVGWKEKTQQLIVNDPAGEADLVNGRYATRQGAGVLYSKKNFVKRWSVHGDGSGYATVLA